MVSVGVLLLYQLLLALPSVLIVSVPQWDRRRLSAKATVAWLAVLLVFFVGIVMVAQMAFGMTFPRLYIVDVAGTAVKVVGFSLLFVNAARQKLFLYSMMLFNATIFMGISNWAELMFRPLLSPDLTGLMCSVVLAVLLAVELPLLLKVLDRLFHAPAAGESSIWNVIWLVPLVFMGLCLMAGNVFQQEASLLFLLSRILAAAALIAMLWMLAYALQQTGENAILRGNNRLVEIRIRAQEEQYKLITESAERAAAARHDLRHHLSVLEGLVQGGDGSGLRQYLAEYVAALPLDAEKLYCSNLSVNALIRHYAGKDGELGFEPEIAVRMPESGTVPDPELCVIFGNLLENALEACADVPAGRRFVRLNCAVIDGSLVITQDNSCDARAKKTGGQYLSAKRGYGEVGVGLASVRAIAEKYGGMAVFEAEGEVFRSSVGMQAPG